MGVHDCDAILADAFVDFEAGSDEATLTTANLSSSTVGSVGAWSFMNGGNSDALIVDVVDAPAIYTAVTVGASTYLGLGTRAIRIDNSKHTNGAVLTLTAPVNNCSAGCFVKCQDNTISGGTQRALDLLAIQGVNDGTSHFVIAQQANSGTKFVAHTENGGSSGVTMSLNTWYWITWKFSKNDKGYVALFNATTGAQVGSTQEFAVGNVQAQSIQFGPTDSHVPIPGDPDSPDTFTLINNLVVSTSGTFPLGP